MSTAAQSVSPPVVVSFPLEIVKTLTIKFHIHNQNELDYVNNDLALTADALDVLCDGAMLEIVSLNGETEATLRQKLQAQEP